ncbi:MAG TPA: glucuronate isomerase [Bryobacteraceae bacterium]|nr:glucuronate isomerase [Bryobacteraceae bacterium]
MSFIHEDFLLTTATARRLYHEFAAAEPILDYHCHLSPKDIAENRRFANLFEIWLEGDHYKWRAMRANGVDERYCTGDASPWKKFLAWARTVPHTLRNPLYHWTHLELKRYFGIEDLLDEYTAPAVWERANCMLGGDDLTAQGILRKFNVTALCTTDDPSDDLVHHKAIAESRFTTRVFPAFRPDKALNVHLPEVFNAWVDRLESAADMNIATLPALVDSLRRRHDYFHEAGCRLSDHGLNHCYADFCTDRQAAKVFDKARGGSPATPEEHARFASFMMLIFGRLDAEKGWTKQLHLGARRGANTRMLKELGPDTGYDSIGDWPQIDALGAYLDRLDRENALPKTIVYNLNPADNYACATMIGNFQGGGIPGKIQLGSGWWFLDQKEAMEWQINALSNAGLLSRFAGMLTDSRSFMSYPRHEYFRRVLCNLLGRDVENGELPDRAELLGPLIRGICYGNARAYLNLPL